MLAGREEVGDGSGVVGWMGEGLSWWSCLSLER